MTHLLFNIITPIIAAVAIFNVAYIFGYWLRKILKTKHNIFLSATTTLIGYGILSYVSLIIFSLSTILLWIFVAALHVMGFKHLKRLYVNTWSQIKNLKTESWTNKLLITGIVFCTLFYLLSAFMPPHRTDAIAYHIPEAITISEHGISPLLIEGSFFGNLPLLMETLYALSYKLQGYTLVHLTHFSIALVGLIAIYGFVSKIWNRRTALLGTLLTFSLYEFFVNATNSYVDAAETIFEITGLLVFISWILNKQKDNSRLLISGSLFGLALATKYNAMYGTLIICLFLITALLLKKTTIPNKIKYLLAFSVPTFFTGGFWYIKNLVMFKNPIYPFYFGHPGYTEIQYSQMKRTIELYVVDQNILNFILIPYHFFLKPYYLIVFAAFITWPLLFLLRNKWKQRSKNQKTILALVSAYTFIYTILWFFFATHQYKFFFVPMVLTIWILAIQTEPILNWIQKRISFKQAIVPLIILGSLFTYPILTAKNSYFLNVKTTEIKYITNSISDADFFEEKNLGDIYKLSAYLKINHPNTNLLNVWSSPNSFVQNTNVNFISVHKLFSEGRIPKSETIKNYLEENNIKLVLIDNFEMNQGQDEPVRKNNPAFQETWILQRIIHNIILGNGTKIYTQGQIDLYEVSL
jgi:hypothetical protein